MWTGRQPHNLPHETNGIPVVGAISNYEGLGVEGSKFDKQKLSDVMAAGGYDVQIGGKEDWLSTGHSLTTMVDSWSIYARFPYDIPSTTGNHIWGDCGGNLTVAPGNKSVHQGDWNIVDKQTKWLESYAANLTSGGKPKPFFMYGGFTIVHPPFATNEKYYNRIDQSLIEIPQWGPLEELHPCDLMTTMKKGCAITPTNAPTPEHPYGTSFIDTDEHKKGVIIGYYAMIAEYDDMVGAYLETLRQTGLEDDTVVILGSDHGEMLMQRRQWYKMAAYEGSTRVPLVVAGPGIAHRGNVKTLASLVDLMPTMLELANVSLIEGLDGSSLVPFLQNGDDAVAVANHPDHIVSQFHGENLAMSWYMIRRDEMKYVVWGTGQEHIPQLFNLTADPQETTNVHNESNHYRALVNDLDALLQETIDYPKVSLSVATYNQQMAKWWMSTQPQWQAILNGTANATGAPQAQQCLANKSLCPRGGSDWGEVWQLHDEEYLEAWNDWLTSEPAIVPCPSNLTYNWPTKGNP